MSLSRVSHEAGATEDTVRTPAQKIVRGAASNVSRFLLSILVATVLPPVLVRHLPAQQYSAWVLILQLSAYVNLLDLGLQTVLSKLIAEHHSRDDHEATFGLLSTSVNLLALLALAGALLVLVMTFFVPKLFAQMPVALYGQVRWGLLLVGLSSALALPFTPFMAVFTGLQEYGYPTLLGFGMRLLSVIALVVLALNHSSLPVMAGAIAVTNLLTAALQVHGWRRYVRSRVRFALLHWNRQAASMLTRSGGVIALWSLGGVLVSGLDTLIVGHYDFANTGYYALAATATNAVVLFISNLFAPVLPAVSAMQATGSAEDTGRMLLRITRYCAVVLCALCLPVLVFAYPLLTLWAGHDYARGSVGFLEILLAGNALRQLAYPYSLVVIATGEQREATLATMSEAVVNFTLSILLARHMGALGVALGTLAGALVSVGLHVTVSMHRTRHRIAFSIPSFLGDGLARPLAALLPLGLLASQWGRYRMVPAAPALLALWILCTSAVLLFVGLNTQDRARLGSWILSHRRT